MAVAEDSILGARLRAALKLNPADRLWYQGTRAPRGNRGWYVHRVGGEPVHLGRDGEKLVRALRAKAQRRG